MRFYRNRLVRGYLGGVRQARNPDRFTGFDGDDNLPAHSLWPPRATADGKNTYGLFHVVNIALNVVDSKRLAWQERKAEPFTISPRRCGSAYKGFRSSKDYGAPRGISLGTAMAISGAAVSPNMGCCSSPSITLLLALFNVRLGWWLGNPGAEGQRAYKTEGPSFAVKPLVEEAFGLTTDDRPYVYLSPTAAISKISACTRWCGGDVDSSSLSTPAILIHFDDLQLMKNRPSDQDTNEQRRFTESQFESYRSLGFEIANRVLSHEVIIRGVPKLTLQQLLATLPATIHNIPAGWNAVAASCAI